MSRYRFAVHAFVLVMILAMHARGLDMPTVSPSPTNCPITATSCPRIDTSCPVQTTSCPVLATECPPIATECPVWSCGPVPAMINHQGKLLSSAGSPVTGTKLMRFEFYNAATAGVRVNDFSEQQSVAVTGGIFNVLIGSPTVGGVPANTFNPTGVFLSVQVEGEELLPRRRIAAVPYALRASESDQADNAAKLEGQNAAAFASKSEVEAALADLYMRLSALEARVPMLAPMCLVPAGSFRTSTDVDVQLDAYYIDKYEVTNELYCKFLNARGNDDHWRHQMGDEINRLGIATPYTYEVVSGFAQKPVHWVTWFDAVDFCAWRSMIEGKPIGSYRLPTEAEWEKAAGWTPGRTALWTYAFQSDTIDSSKANYSNDLGVTTPVGWYTAWTSYYGCYDMSGNLWEWCSDWYGDPYPSSTLNPTGPATGTGRVLRGGSFAHVASSCSVIQRYYNAAPSYVGLYNGFRCARAAQ